MVQVKSVGVLSLAKMTAAVQAGLGLLFVPFFLLFGVIGMAAGGRDSEAALGGGIMLLMALFMPVMYAAIGFLIGAIAGFLYNLVAGWLGGVELNLEALPMTVPAVAPAPYLPPPPPIA